jgi:acetolactate synthase-1/2/3 large subunit
VSICRLPKREQTSLSRTNRTLRLQPVRTPDALHRTDAKAAAEVIVSRLKEQGISRRGWRSNEIAAKIATTAENPDAKPYTPTPGTLDPRPVVKELDAAVPKDWDIIVAGGHCFSFAMTHLRDRSAQGADHG